jgi:hypothetical protein
MRAKRAYTTTESVVPDDPILRLPPQFQRPLHLLREIGQDNYAAVLSALEVMSIATSPDSAARSVAADAVIDDADALAIIEFGVSTRALISRWGHTVEVISRAVTAAYVSLEGSGEVDADGLRERVVGVLDTSYVVYQEKAARLTTAAPQTIQTSRCLTDLRPVFAEGTGDEVRGFLVLHMLELEVLEGDEVRSVYFNVDSTMLSALGETVSRALGKASALGEVIATSGYDNMTLERSN